MTDARGVGVALEGAVETIVRKVQIRSLQALQFSNPVDTGWSRGAWTPTVGSASTEPRPRPADRDVANKLGARFARGNLAAARRIETSYRVQQGRVFIVNNAPYIVFLNMGTSSQAPKAFIERAITRAIRSLGRQRL